jgi:hypothetical protein
MDCPLCYEKFDLFTRVPRFLICGHTFCHCCLTQLERRIKSQPPNLGDGSRELIESGMEGESLTEENCIIIDCSQCRRRTTTQRGTDELSKNYSLINIIEEENRKKTTKHINTETCNLHSNKKISYYCESCTKPFCSECLLSHNGHDYNPIKKIGNFIIPL